MADRDPASMGPAPFAPLDFPAVQSVRRDMVDAYHAMTVRLLADIDRMLDASLGAEAPDVQAPRGPGRDG